MNDAFSQSVNVVMDLLLLLLLLLLMSQILENNLVLQLFLEKNEN